MDKKDAFIEEYKSLREKIMKRQDVRLTIFGSSVTGTGTVIGLALRDSSLSVQVVNFQAFALICLTLVINNRSLVANNICCAISNVISLP